MTNQEAIELLKIERDHMTPTVFTEIVEAIDMAIKALEAQEAKTQLSREDTTLWEAQELSKNSPKLDKENGDLQPTCNQLATVAKDTNVLSNDCISRQAALDEIDGFLAVDKYYHPYSQEKTIPVEEMRERLKQLPSAQPEIEERTEEFAQNVPKEDLISRKVAIDALAKHEKSNGHNYTLFVDIVSECAEIIRDLPSAQPEPHWIPISERLPEASGRYLATRGLNACGAIWNRVYIINYSDLMGLKSERIWWDGNVGKSDFERIDDVIAWQPLPEQYMPEPYRAERRTDDANDIT